MRELAEGLIEIPGVGAAPRLADAHNATIATLATRRAHDFMRRALGGERGQELFSNRHEMSSRTSAR
jgi:hypothetical protein